jgi:Transposase DDE domain
MQRTVALRERGRVAALLDSILRAARRRGGWEEPDRRNLRTWRHLVLGVLVQRSTRLLHLAQAVLSERQASRVKTAALGLGYFLARAAFPIGPFSRRRLLAIVRELSAERLVRYRGKVLLVLDPTEYPKRSRGRGKRGRQMQHIGRVRKKAQGQPKAVRSPAAAPGRPKPAAAKPATTFGYVDIWAGLVLASKQFLPLTRQLFSAAHPQLPSQPTVEDAVLAQALAMLRALKLPSIVVGDRGLGRKERLIALATRAQAFVFRIDADISVLSRRGLVPLLLAERLAQQPWLGETVWDGGEDGPTRCRVRAARAAIRFSRTGRQADFTEAVVNFVALVPLDPTRDSLVLATTLPAGTLADCKGVAWVYAQRWSVETAFETMKAWGLERFMVRAWRAIDRLLWIVALAYALLVLALHDPRLTRLCQQASALLWQLTVLGRHLTPGKLAEALGLDFVRHRRAWTAVWLH